MTPDRPMVTTDLLTNESAWPPRRRQPDDLFLLPFRQPFHRNTSRSIQLDRKAQTVDPLRSQPYCCAQAGLVWMEVEGRWLGGASGASWFALVFLCPTVQRSVGDPGELF